VTVRGCAAGIAQGVVAGLRRLTSSDCERQ